MPKGAIVVQVFVKLDLLKRLCESLLETRGIEDYVLIFYSDTSFGSRREDLYTIKNAEVLSYIGHFKRIHENRFFSIELKQNPQNFGPCKTCRLALDYAFSSNDFVIMTEDDTIFSKDTLEWLELAAKSPEFALSADVWAIAGESIFFNARDKNVSEETRHTAIQYAQNNRLNKYYILEKFMPSTFFATTKLKWSEFGETRGQPNGDVDVCRRCASENKATIFPIVARVKDVGMLHEDGYSVLIHQKENVSEIKNTYVTSDDISTPFDFLQLYPGDKNKLFSMTTILLQFEDEKIETKDKIISARQKINDQDWSSAFDSWLQVYNTDHHTLEVTNMLALACLKLGKIESSLYYLEESLTISPKNYFSLVLKAFCLEENKCFRDAYIIWDDLRKSESITQEQRDQALDRTLFCAQKTLRKQHT